MEESVLGMSRSIFFFFADAQGDSVPAARVSNIGLVS